MRVLVLGVTGMLGHTVFRWLRRDPGYEVWGTLREQSGLQFFSEAEISHLASDLDVLDVAALDRVVRQVQPALVINCIGVVKQLAASHDPLVVLPLNSMLPHRLARLTAEIGARLIHVSTDCVFSGRQGNYRESDTADATDLYGQSKYIGEVRDQSHVLTVRVSIIGHELASHRSLVDWFLSQDAVVTGYTAAVFSGLPTVELARVFHEVVVPQPDLSGLYHVSALPVSKYDLLRIVADVYGKPVTLTPSQAVVIDRSLNSERFTAATGYVAPAWPDLVQTMHAWRDL